MIDQEEIHNQCLSEDPEERIKALEQLEDYFSLLPDKEQAWNYLHRLTNDEDIGVRYRVASALDCVFPEVSDKRKAWDDLIKLTDDEYADVRYRAVSALGSAFSHMPDEQKAWNDLTRLAHDEDIDIRREAASILNSSYSHDPYNHQEWEELHKLIDDEDNIARREAAFTLGSSFYHILDKQKAWIDLHKLINDEDSFVRTEAALALSFAFSHVPDKQQAWDDLIKLTNDEITRVRRGAISALDSSPTYVPNKQKVWEDLVKLANSGYEDVRSWAIVALGSTFPHMPDKQQAWDNLVRLTNDEDIDIRREAVSALSHSFSHFPDKQLIWNDLHRLINDKDKNVRRRAVSALYSAFSHIPDKQIVWNDLHRVTNDEDSGVRCRAVFAFDSAFSHFPDKQVVWNDFHKLTTDENREVRCRAAFVFGSSFSQIPDKQKAWGDLNKLIHDKDNTVRKEAVSALCSVFPYLIDKRLAWNNLHGLINDEDNFVRTEVASALGYVFPHIPDKQLVYNDLNVLANDEDSDVIAYANHSLGRVSIFKASQAEKEEDYKEELEKALSFFEKAAQESFYSGWENPSQFCLPFYRSFYTIIFKRQEAKEEVDKYLEEAKSAIEGSKSKELLFEAVKNLAEALREVQDLGNLDFKAKKYKLEFYRKYCDRAAELIKDTEETAPFATIALRKGLPILDRNLKTLIEEIQEKAKITCQVSQGTSTQEIACSVSKEVQKWEISSQEEITFKVESFISTLESKIPRLPENEHIFKMITNSKDQKDINKLLENTSELIEIIPEITFDPERMKPTIGIITALPKEYAAVNILLENKNDKYKIPGSGAGRRYCLGEISSEDGNKHNLVLATAGMGNNIAATRAALLLEHFPNVKSVIMVGIAGGIPYPYEDKVDDHVRLGDIVVSNGNGVIQYDLIKQEIQEITHRNLPRPPSASLLEAVGYLEAEEIFGNHPWEKYIVQSLSQLKTKRPSDDKDILYSSGNQDEIIPHPEDQKRTKGQPRVFIGPIASANILQKDPNARDKLRDKFKVKAIEMEASGIADATWNHEVGYLAVRGICDYCDSHKNDEWQQYAAVVAAAYTRALIESMP